MTVCAQALSLSLSRPRGGVKQRTLVSVCAACSIISVLTQWGATLVIKLRGRRERARTSDEVSQVI